MLLGAIFVTSKKLPEIASIFLINSAAQTEQSGDPVYRILQLL